MSSRILPDRPATFAAAKVPAIGLLFWTIKLLTTGIGEATSDFLGNEDVALAGLIGIGGFWWALRRQLRATEYHAPTYWGAVLAVAVFGTMAADGVKDGTGMPYWLTTVFSGALTAAVFRWWHRSEGTLSIHSIVTPRRERFYWGAVLCTFALGTAAGDLTGIELPLGFFGSAALYGGLMLVPALAWWRGWISPVACFWAAYVLTRPLGASFADGFAKPRAATGLDLGDGTVTAVGLAVFAALVVYVTRTRSDVQDGDHRAPGGSGDRATIASAALAP